MLALRDLPGRCRKPGDDPSCEEIILLLIFIMSYTAIHLASWANVRYRLPIDAVLIIFAAYAIEQIYERWLAPTMVRREVGINWQSPEDI